MKPVKRTSQKQKLEKEHTSGAPSRALGRRPCLSTIPPNEPPRRRLPHELDPRPSSGRASPEAVIPRRLLQRIVKCGLWIGRRELVVGHTWGRAKPHAVAREASPAGWIYPVTYVPSAPRQSGSAGGAPPNPNGGPPGVGPVTGLQWH